MVCLHKQAIKKQLRHHKSCKYKERSRRGIGDTSTPYQYSAFFFSKTVGACYSVRQVNELGPAAVNQRLKMLILRRAWCCYDFYRV